MKGESYLCQSKNVRKIRQNALNTLYKSLMFPCNYRHSSLAKHVLEISDYSGQCLVSISLKPNRAQHETGIDKEMEERDRERILMHSKIKSKKTEDPRKNEKE